MPPSKRKQHHSRSQSVWALLVEFRFEISIIVLILAGSYLLIEQTDVSENMFQLIKRLVATTSRVIAGIARFFYEQFMAIETSDIVGILLILVAVHLMILRSRKKLSLRYGTFVICPNCNSEKIVRTHRNLWQKLIGAVLIMVTKNYKCQSCQKNYLTFSYRE